MVLLASSTALLKEKTFGGRASHMRFIHGGREGGREA